jgi:hypothetical protein
VSLSNFRAWLVLIWVVTAQWSGIIFGSLQISDLVLAAVLLAAVLGPGRVGSGGAPVGIVVALCGIGLASLMAALIPVSSTWLAMRFTGFGKDLGAEAGVADAGLGGVAFLIKLSLATLGAWLALGELDRRKVDRAPQLLAMAWIFGSTVSALVGIAQWKAGLDTSAYLAHPADSPRASGLAFHPNTFALYTAACIPLVAIYFRRSRRVFLGLILLVILWGGVIAADSRIGLLVASLSTALIPFLVGRSGKVAIILTTVGLPVLPVLVAGAAWLLANTRLNIGAAEQSDVGRQMVFEQAKLDFLQSPVWGIGFGESGGAPSVPLALLAGGGLISILAFAAFLIWAYSVALRSVNDLDVRVLLVSATSILGVMLVQNNVIDRGQYLPLLAAVIASRRLNQGVGMESPSKSPLTTATENFSHQTVQCEAAIKCESSSSRRVELVPPPTPRQVVLAVSPRRSRR